MPAAQRLVESVLHPTDFSAASQRAFAHALAIASLRGTRLTLLHVERAAKARADWQRFPAVRETLERWGLLAPGSSRAAVADELGVQVKKVTVASDDPAAAVIEHLAREPADLIVLATEGRDGVARWREGSVAEAVARGAQAMTLFVPAAAEREIVSLADGKLRLHRVLVPIDHQPDPSAALEFAQRAAGLLGDGSVEIVLLHVGLADGAPDPVFAPAPPCTLRRLAREGDPVEQILAVARETEADLIVMATAGHGGVFEALRGSTTERVLRGAPCPLLAVPARAATRPA